MILSKLGLSDSFDQYIFGADKPHSFGRLAPAIMGRFGAAPDQIASVGDNMRNEITPAARMGMRTVFIDRHRHGRDLDTDLRVEGLRQFLPLLTS